MARRPGALYALMLKVVGLVLAVLAIIFLLQNRASVAAWIAGEPAGSCAAGPASAALSARPGISSPSSTLSAPT